MHARGHHHRGNLLLWKHIIFLLFVSQKCMVAVLRILRRYHPPFLPKISTESAVSRWQALQGLTKVLTYPRQIPSFMRPDLLRGATFALFFFNFFFPSRLEDSWLGCRRHRNRIVGGVNAVKSETTKYAPPFGPPRSVLACHSMSCIAYRNTGLSQERLFSTLVTGLAPTLFAEY